MLPDVKSYLRISWDTDDELLTKTIERGKKHLNSLTGVTLDFTEEGDAKSLLLDYCRYCYNSALEYFDLNFSSQILRLQMEAAINDANQE